MGLDNVPILCLQEYMTLHAALQAAIGIRDAAAADSASLSASSSASQPAATSAMTSSSQSYSSASKSAPLSESSSATKQPLPNSHNGDSHQPASLGIDSDLAASASDDASDSSATSDLDVAEPDTAIPAVLLDSGSDEDEEDPSTVAALQEADIQQMQQRAAALRSQMG